MLTSFQFRGLPGRLPDLSIRRILSTPVAQVHTSNSPSLKSTPPQPRRESRQLQSTAASDEIGLLFYFRKQFASVIKSFRATPAILRSLDPRKRAKQPPSSILRLVFLAFSSRERDALMRHGDGLHLNFGFFDAPRKTSVTRESVMG